MRRHNGGCPVRALEVDNRFQDAFADMNILEIEYLGPVVVLKSVVRYSTMSVF